MLRKTIWCHGIRSRECFVHFHRTIAIEANKSKMKNLFFGSFSFGHSFWWENRKCVCYRSLKSSLIPISLGKKCLDKVSSGTFTCQYNCCISCFLFFFPTNLPVYQFIIQAQKWKQNKINVGNLFERDLNRITNRLKLSTKLSQLHTYHYDNLGCGKQKVLLSKVTDGKQQSLRGRKLYLLETFSWCIVDLVVLFLCILIVILTYQDTNI